MIEIFLLTKARKIYDQYSDFNYQYSQHKTGKSHQSSSLDRTSIESSFEDRTVFEFFRV